MDGNQHMDPSNSKCNIIIEPKAILEMLLKDGFHKLLPINLLPNNVRVFEYLMNHKKRTRYASKKISSMYS